MINNSMFCCLKVFKQHQISKSNNRNCIIKEENINNINLIDKLIKLFEILAESQKKRMRLTIKILEKEIIKKIVDIIVDYCHQLV